MGADCAVRNKTLPWIEATRLGLAEMEALPADWDGEGSPQTDPALVASARALLARLEGEALAAVPTPYVIPVQGGGSFQIEWDALPKHLELEFSARGTVLCLVEEEREIDVFELASDNSDAIGYLLYWLMNKGRPDFVEVEI